MLVMPPSFFQCIKRALRYILKGVPQQVRQVVKADVYYTEPGKRLAGKRILITGGGRGLGLAMAERFIAEGASVLIAGRNEALLAEKSRQLNCLYMVLDVCDVIQFPAFIKTAAEKLGGIDILVSNAGISLHEGNILNVQPEQFDAQIATNLRGGYFMAQQFIEQALGTGKPAKASVLFVSSERGSFADDLPYGLTKAAVNSLTQGLAYRYAKEGIRVNAISPGVTASDMTGFDKDGDLRCSYNLTGRVYLPEEVAEIACFLVSDAARCLNGQIIVCNEGNSLHYRQKYYS